MSIFSNLNTNGMQEAKDSLGGYSPLDTDVYEATIKAAYVTLSAKGAMCVNLVLSIADREYREQVYVTSSKGENFYLTPKGDKVPLPGFQIMDDICICTCDKHLSEMDTEDKVFEIYDKDAKKNLPKSVPTITEIMGKKILVAIVKELRDINELDQSTNTYVPSGKTREDNVINKVFEINTQMTVSEAKQGKETAQFMEKWLARNKGKTIDRTSKDKKKPAAAPAPKARESLFGKKA